MFKMMTINTGNYWIRTFPPGRRVLCMKERRVSIWRYALSNKHVASFTEIWCIFKGSFRFSTSKWSAICCLNRKIWQTMLKLENTPRNQHSPSKSMVGRRSVPLRFRPIFRWFCKFSGGIKPRCGLLGFECRCGYTFCGKHRHAEVSCRLGESGWGGWFVQRAKSWLLYAIIFCLWLFNTLLNQES